MSLLFFTLFHFRIKIEQIIFVIPLLSIQFQKLSMLKTQISNKKNVPADHIVLMFKDKKVSDHETPNSIGYIQGLVMSKY